MICPKNEENFTPLMFLKPSRLTQGLSSSRMGTLAFLMLLAPSLAQAQVTPITPCGLQTQVGDPMAVGG